GLTLSNVDAAAMRELMAPLLHSYEFLEAAPNALPTLKYPRRTHHFPEDKDNPFRAWYVKTAIEGASSGPLAGRTVAIKDVIFIAGVPMMNGASIMDGFVPDFDATV